MTDKGGDRYSSKVTDKGVVISAENTKWKERNSVILRWNGKERICAR